MRIARIETADGPEFAVERGGSWICINSPFERELVETGHSVTKLGAHLLAPIEPRVVVGMAHNGRPSERLRPAQAFLKSARTIAGPTDAITVDRALGRTVIEGEMGIVIGTDARRLTPENALAAVLGYTVANDVSAPDQNELDSFWTQTKNGANFTPIGPWIDTNFDPSDATIRVTRNGQLEAEASMNQLARGVKELLVYVTQYVTLGPGDVVMAGCPGTLCEVLPGDNFEIEIVGLGILPNTAA